MTVFRAYFDTRHFEFEGYGATAEEAVAVCYAGWTEHCRTYLPGTTIDPDIIKLDDIAVYEVAVGVAYRDREAI